MPADALVISEHPKFMERWASNYVDWYQRMGKANADIKLLGMFKGDTVKALSPFIVKEFQRRGFKM